MKGSLFSDSWFKVSGLRVGLLSSVDIQKQYYRGALWYVLRDRFNNNYFRITPEAYSFVSMLTPEKTVQTVWEESLERYREKAPSQDDVIGLLSELHMNNLLYFSNLPNNDFMFERLLEKRQKELKNKLLSVIAIKIPLWNPNQWLSKVKPFIHTVFSAKGVAVWAMAVIWGIKTAMENFALIYDRTQGMLSPNNLFLLYISLAVLKIFHELSHAMATKRFGGQVPSLGVIFLVFTPLPYMDATSNWFFQKKRHRLLAGSAGMLSDLFFSSIAALVWAHTGEGLIHSLAFNIMIIGSVSSLAFNGNPLLRFDAYYLLSDALEIPNLYQKSRRQIVYWTEKYIFKAQGLTNPLDSAGEAFWLAAYAVASFIYRILISIAIILFVADRIFALGLLLLVISIFAGLLFPLKKFIVYLHSSPKLLKVRKRAYAVSAAAAISLVALIGFCPFPYSLRAPGVVEAKKHSRAYAETEGRLQTVYFKNGAYVKKGALIAELSNPELELDLEAVKAAIAQNDALRQRAVFESAADIKPLLERHKVLMEQLKDLKERQNKLYVRALTSGFFIAPEIEAMKGIWLKRQTKLGELTSNDGFKFSGIVSQEQASDIFRGQPQGAEIKLHGRAGETFKLSNLTVIPYQKDELPSAALGWFGGGNIAVTSTDAGGKKAAEPFFEIIGYVQLHSSQNVLLHGHSGVLRLALPPEPLAVQGFRLAKQTIQKRYKI